MPKVEASEVIQRPIEEVFAYLSDPANELEWQSSARERELAADALEKGARIKATDTFLGRKLEFVYEVTEHEPSTCIAARSVSGPFQAGYEYELAREDGGTRVVWRLEGEAGFGGIFGKLVDPVMTKLGERESRSDLAKLKAVLEA